MSNIFEKDSIFEDAKKSIFVEKSIFEDEEEYVKSPFLNNEVYDDKDYDDEFEENEDEYDEDYDEYDEDDDEWCCKPCNDHITKKSSSKSIFKEDSIFKDGPTIDKTCKCHRNHDETINQIVDDTKKSILKIISLIDLFED